MRSSRELRSDSQAAAAQSQSMIPRRPKQWKLEEDTESLQIPPGMHIASDIGIICVKRPIGWTVNEPGAETVGANGAAGIDNREIELVTRAPPDSKTGQIEVLRLEVGSK